ncbi:MAG: hypothetical protein M1339_03110, partial [Bacteroidetes bacterium]|nr:hypothetical protein [Bacteroidota bacterium]
PKALPKCHERHSRVLLSGIHSANQARFPFMARGNDAPDENFAAMGRVVDKEGPAHPKKAS